MSPPDLKSYFRCVKHMRRVLFRNDRWYHEAHISNINSWAICDSARILYFSCTELDRDTATAFLEVRNAARPVQAPDTGSGEAGKHEASESPHS